MSGIETLRSVQTYFTKLHLTLRTSCAPAVCVQLWITVGQSHGAPSFHPKLGQ